MVGKVPAGQVRGSDFESIIPMQILSIMTDISNPAFDSRAGFHWGVPGTHWLR